jgi:galactose oxidase
VNMDSAVTSFALIRMGSATHTVNTDQRRIPLGQGVINGLSYTVTVPKDPGCAMPGYWMLFALNAQGVPSVASIVKVTL